MIKKITVIVVLSFILITGCQSVLFNNASTSNESKQVDEVFMVNEYANVPTIQDEDLEIVGNTNSYKEHMKCNNCHFAWSDEIFGSSSNDNYAGCGCNSGRRQASCELINERPCRLNNCNDCEHLNNCAKYNSNSCGRSEGCARRKSCERSDITLT
ncbi:MAG: hypothetical protein LBD23_16175 [Oscillospiraceae bacterium]|jgi:hypothetical protein|nr:hypothetical protein [Oscillospiraceae bacterium]